MNDRIKDYCIGRNYAQHIVNGGLEGLLASWETTSKEIAAGHPVEFHEFLNDLDGRRIIAEIMDLLIDKDIKSTVARLETADQRFLAATRESAGCIWGRTNEAEKGYLRANEWWYYRVPRDAPDWSMTEWK